ncbi:hypothetical protein [Streptosporangium sp. V21-05]|uniref:hypothetical protein n=1 Tax=Streptosporangium sp. V21-05 TaxID=3446115 RepID=UPI003F531911
MDQNQLFDRIHFIAQTILDRLSDEVFEWRVLNIENDSQLDQPEPLILDLRSTYGNNSFFSSGDLPPGVKVEVGATRAKNTYFATYPLVVSEPDAIVTLASQIQDHLIEESWGSPLPACPGHTHPLSADNINEVAVWRCPASSEYYTTPIISSNH